MRKLILMSACCALVACEDDLGLPMNGSVPDTGPGYGQGQEDAAAEDTGLPVDREDASQVDEDAGRMIEDVLGSSDAGDGGPNGQEDIGPDRRDGATDITDAIADASIPDHPPLPQEDIGPRPRDGSVIDVQFPFQDADLDSGIHPDAIIPDSGIHPDAIIPDSGIHPDAIIPDSGIHPDAIVPDSGIHPDAIVPDSGIHPDAIVPDSGIHPDAIVPDTGFVFPDADPPDNGLHADAIIPDSGIHPDAIIPDSGIHPDAIIPDSGIHPDADPPDTGLPPDTDGDTISDPDEGTGDKDGDGIPNFMDTDTDGDGIDDIIEAGDMDPLTPPVDTDNDGVPDFCDLDSDNDTISDMFEGLVDTDLDTVFDFRDLDSDNDTIEDALEAGDTSTTTPPVDTDMDMTPDFRDLDSDGDTIFDMEETNDDADMDMLPNRIDLDSDADNWPDMVEAGDTDLNTPPVDTENDGLPDFIDPDSDDDTLGDIIELGCNVDSTERLIADSDMDTFSDPIEIALGTDPCAFGSQPMPPVVILPPNGPPGVASIMFTETAIDRADFMINVDTTGSMEGEIENIKMTLSSTIIPQVSAVIPDSAFGVSSFDDFPIDPFGSAITNDIPFRLATRITTSATQAQAAVDTLTTTSLGSGNDFPESGLEAVHQIATGAGVTWPTGTVPPFDPAQGLIPGTADGMIGGAGFRQDALPVIVHVTDSVSHTQSDYHEVDMNIGAASTSTVQAALQSIGARVVAISTGIRPFNDLVCQGLTASFIGALTPVGQDVDYYELTGVMSGQTVTARTQAQTAGSFLNTRVALANANGIIAENDDQVPGSNTDGAVTAVVTGPPPYYVIVAESMDTTYTGTVGATAGHYLMDVQVSGGLFLAPTPLGCRADDGNDRMSATPLVDYFTIIVPNDPEPCQRQCEQIMGPLNSLFQNFTYPIEMADETEAVVPRCAWDQFGPGRPAGCPPGLCCTGRNGAGEPSNPQGMCPLSFSIDGSGVGIDAAMVAGIEALVRFSPFTVSTTIRPDPMELMATGLDTTCFVRDVVASAAAPPNSCAPLAIPVDLDPRTPDFDAFENVVPGTALTFDINVQNQIAGTMNPCVQALPQPRAYQVFVDVVADGVTVVDTRPINIVVLPQ